MGAYLTHAKIELTNRCTHRCSFCYNPERSEVELPFSQDFDQVTPEFLGQILDKTIAHGIDSYTFTGGEPFLRRDLLFYGLEKIYGLKRITSINSNLSLCTPEDAQRLQECGVFSVGSTFHSVNEETFNNIAGAKTYHQVVQGIKNLTNAKVPLSVNIVVGNQNKADVYATARYLCEELGVDAISITPIFPSIPEHINQMVTREELISLLDVALSLKERRGIPLKTLRPLPNCMFPDDPKYDLFRNVCSAGFGEITVTATGDFKICASYHGLQGSIFDKSIEELIQSGLQEDFLKDRAAECTPCSHQCGSGCPLEEKIFHTAGISHPYRDTVNPLTKKRKDRAPIPKLLHHSVEFDPQTKFRRRGDDTIGMSAFGGEINLNSAEFTTLSELIKHQSRDKKYLPWDLAMELVLEKNIFNAFLIYLNEGGVIKIN